MSREPWTNGPVTLYTGHVLEVLGGLAAESVQCVVTSPPYWGLRSYSVEPVVWDAEPGCEHEWEDAGTSDSRIRNGATGGLHEGRAINTLPIMLNPSQGSFCLRCGAWRGSLGLEPQPQLFVQHLVEVFREVRRVLRSDGVCFLNLGDSYAGSGGAHAPDHANPGLSKSWERNGVPHWGELGQPGNYLAPGGLKPKDLVGIPWRVALALQEDGWWLRADIIWAKPNPMPESVTDRPTRSHEYIFLLTKGERYYWDQEAVREGLAESTLADGRNGSGRNPPKYDSKYEEPGAPMPSWYRGKTFVNPMQGRNLRSVWTISTQPYSGAHFATFPEALVERCILAGTSERGCCPECGAPWERVVERKAMVIVRSGRAEASGNRTMPAGTMVSPPESRTTGWRAACVHPDLAPVPCQVLDPFSGAGTVALVAQRLGRRAIGVDLSPQYTALAVKRLEEVPLPMGSG